MGHHRLNRIARVDTTRNPSDAVEWVDGLPVEDGAEHAVGTHGHHLVESARTCWRLRDPCTRCDAEPQRLGGWSSRPRGAHPRRVGSAGGSSTYQSV
eukprot:scaffold227838_cov39-Tisochrysis_lutea.AAC.3